ncbi:MAG: thioesterase family protein [Sneathiella sp.]|nr:thioesterase family protein [Sneathiella sp.]
MSNPEVSVLHEQRVLPDWIDYNKHMNVAYYVLIFDQSLDVFLDEIGLTREYREASGCTVYVLETHVTYLQEVYENNPLTISVRVLDCDEKRMHLFLEMRHRDEGFLAATSEQMILHIDKSGPRAAPMPEYLQTRLQEHKDRDAAVPKPEQAGARIGIRHKSK